MLPPDNNCYNDDCQNCQQHGCCHTSCNGHGVSIFIFQAIGASESWKKMQIIICIAMLHPVYTWLDTYICNVHIYGNMVVICFF